MVVVSGDVPAVGPVPCAVVETGTVGVEEVEAGVLVPLGVAELVWAGGVPVPVVVVCGAEGDSGRGVEGGCGAGDVEVLSVLPGLWGGPLTLVDRVRGRVLGVGPVAVCVAPVVGEAEAGGRALEVEGKVSAWVGVTDEVAGGGPPL